MMVAYPTRESLRPCMAAPDELEKTKIGPSSALLLVTLVCGKCSPRAATQIAVAATRKVRSGARSERMICMELRGCSRARALLPLGSH